MDRFCVFCGEKPVDKTKEHIIPQWLIKYTGDFNRNINVGVDRKKKKIRSFSFNSLTFPACKKCNDKFSELEAQTKPIFLKLLEKNFIETNVLLDWFDKVRIGLWLLFYSLNENPLSIMPRFHIKNRLGQSDRMIIIYKVNSLNKGINFFGVDNLAFQMQPSCFLIRINNYLFFNVSKEFLFSRRIGFPYPQKIYQIENNFSDKVYVKLKKGIKRKIVPLIRRNHFINGIELYQPMICNHISKEDYYYKNEYVKSNCSIFKNGTGKIFYYDKKNKQLLTDHRIVLLNRISNFNFKDNFENLIIQTLNFQNRLLKESYDIELIVSEERIKYFKESTNFAIDYNNRLIESLKQW